ncbi:MAG: DUF3320 domain-containing protein [Bacillus sp. (in: Bacteria)]|nr:DUF3320 domain-containing protein [Bacillus sp. (in: firmicutes)]
MENVGYQVAPQVGSAGFFIDLAIVNPDAPGRYLLGIECDGAAYHSARSARDRDRLRQEVLEGLGWRIHRIWSTDWFRHPERELKKVVAAIEQAKVFTKVDAPVKKVKLEQKGVQKINRDDSVEKAPSSSVIDYEMAQLQGSFVGLDFYSLYPEELAQLVTDVVKTESPVHVSEVMKRICNAFGIKRIGSRIQERFEEVFRLSKDVTKKGDFLWLANMTEAPVRIRSGAIRKIELICQEEYEQAILEVVGLSFGVQTENLAHLVYRLLGFTRVTEEMKSHLDGVVKRMIDKGALLDKNGELHVVNNRAMNS